ncbi:MAG TPA: OmpA family protein [Chryseosolibacter sp.]
MVTRFSPFATWFFLLALLLYGRATGQVIHTLDDGYYCVVGTFQFTQNALAFKQSVIARGISVEIGKDIATGFNYVHLGKASSKENAVTSALLLRKQTSFSDAWVKRVGAEPDQSAAVASDSTIVQVSERLVSLSSAQRPVMTQVEVGSNNTMRYLLNKLTVLDHVYFFTDASVLEPESQDELTTLLQLLESNATYRIRLHGHSNGNKRGRIISPGENLFSLEGATETFGTAKELAAKRAGVIKQFLVKNGIAEDRIETISWGGDKPRYNKRSEDAKKNLRVEVEILPN